MVAPFPYFGGKRRVAELVWERLGDVNNYVEPFVGSAAVLLARPHRLVPYQVETINDLDGEITNVWRSIRYDPEGVIDGADWPVSELDLHAEADRIKRTREGFVEWLREDIEHHDAHRAGRWIWGQCGMIGDSFDCASKAIPSIGIKGRGVHRHTPDLRVCRETIARKITPLAARLRAVRICCGDWRRVIGPSALWPGAANRRTNIAGIFLDPPYLEGSMQYAAGGTGSTLALDVLEWCEQWGEEPTLRIALCGYEGHYDALAELGWTAVRWKANGGYGSQGDGEGRENSAREVIWFSPACLGPAQHTLF